MKRKHMFKIQKLYKLQKLQNYKIILTKVVISCDYQNQALISW